ncbi:MAG: hypothetical protein KC636_13820, partial [Myxococcales bacterium]|nr:hypothetical protein [Myxococcales bacterium]
EEARRRGAEEAHALVDGARAEARRIHDEALEHARLARERILGEHRDELGAIALEAARRVVGQLGGGLDLLFARRAAERLRDEQGIDEGESITLVTAPSAAVDELRAAVREVLGRAVPIAIQVDARLLGGVRLRARGREFEASAGLALAEGLARGAAHEPAREAS